MTILTASGSFAEAYTSQFDASIASIRELGEAKFLEKIKTATTIIHNAATVETTDLDLSIDRNFDFTRFLVRNIQAINPRAHFILLSSMSILSPSDDQSYGDVLAMTSYSYSKYLAETYSLKSDLANVSSVRFSTLFFKNFRKDGLSKLINDAVTANKITVFNSGEAKRNFMPIEIAAQYVEKITKLPGNGKRTFTIAAPQATSFSEVAILLQKLLPKLNIEDKALPAGTPVLADFSSRDIEELGLIDFSLEEEIKTYFNSLKS